MDRWEPPASSPLFYTWKCIILLASQKPLFIHSLGLPHPLPYYLTNHLQDVESESDVISMLHICPLPPPSSHPPKADSYEGFPVFVRVLSWVSSLQPVSRLLEQWALEWTDLGSSPIIQNLCKCGQLISFSVYVNGYKVNTNLKKLFGENKMGSHSKVLAATNHCYTTSWATYQSHSSSTLEDEVTPT